VDSPEKVKEVKEKYGVDGVMIGRASIGYPWVFNEIKHFLKTNTHLEKPTLPDRVTACKRHLQHSIEWKGEVLGIAEMKRHYTNYFKGISHFKEYRIKLVTSYSLEEIIETLDRVAVEFEGVKF
jgi:tRNA-dihydrouridine synthase